MELNKQFYNKTKIKNNYLSNTIGNVLNFFLCLLSFFIAIYVFLFVSEKAYNYLFLLPLSFCFCSLIFKKIYKKVLSNFAFLLIIVLFFIRLVFTPFLMVLGNYYYTIALNAGDNITLSVVLMIYEQFLVFSVMYYFTRFKQRQRINIDKTIKLKKSFVYCLLLLIVVFLIFLKICPDLLDSMRTIFQIKESNFSSFEDGMLDSKYDGQFVTKLALVAGRYLRKILLLLVPATIILILVKKQNKLRLYLSFLTCFVPLFFIGGAIASSLINLIILLFFRSLLLKSSIWKMLIIFLFAGIAALSYWLIRKPANDFLASFAGRFHNYFSGVNIVSGAFNLPRTFELRLHYFIRDYIGSIPFGNTIFGLSGDAIQPFFNNSNGSVGQIPTTIGMGYYYFGIILSPLYSVFFAFLACRAGERIKSFDPQRPIKGLMYIEMIIVFSMGIIMYNIEITFRAVFSLILPILILEKLTYGFKK